MKIEKFKVLLYLKKSGLDKNGKAPIMGRITVNRTMAQFSCKLSCTPSLWNPRASRLVGKSKEAVETNKDIDLLLLSIQKAFDGLVEKRMDFEAKDVKEVLQGSVKTQVTLLSFVDEHIGELSTHEGIDLSKSSIWTYKKIRKNLAEFICEKYKLTDLAFGQLTEPFISEFHHYLLDEKGYSSGTIIIYVSLFKKMCRIAFERGLSKNLLFAHYRVGTPRVTTPKALTMSDFIKIRDIELPEDKLRLSISRDLFLFACYAGTAYVDTVSITKANIKVLEDGDKWLVYHRKKTGTLARVKLLPEALELMEKYKDETRDTLFPLLGPNCVRIDLITICKLAGTSKTYSYHSGRHSFASLITLEAGVPMILCRITIDGKSTALPTGISCAPQDWNAKKGEIRNVRDNGRLASFITEVKDKYNSLLVAA